MNSEHLKEMLTQITIFWKNWRVIMT
jgi:hypothetical protein